MNKFCLLSCRFHIKDRQKLLIQGYFEDGEMDENRPVLALDYTVLDYHIDTRTMMKNPLDYMEGRGGNKRYFFVVSLPENYREFKELRCFQYEGEEMGEIFHLSVKWLEKLKEKEEFYIDEATYSNGEFRIRGWCVYRKGMQIYLSEGPDAGSAHIGLLTRVERPDVESQCPDCCKEDIFGFSITGEYHGKALWCIVEDKDGNKRSVNKIQLGRAGIEKKRTQFKELTRKIQVYYQQFGVARTVNRMWEKLSRKETTTYQAWRWKHQLTPKELERQRTRNFAIRPSYAIVVPLYHTPKDFLEVMVKSVLNQSYTEWRLYLSEGSGPQSPLRRILERYEKMDNRITVIYNEQSLQIAENTNRALKQVKEDYVVFMDHDDFIAPEALYECTRVLNEKPDTEIIYTDEDKVSMNGKTFFQPHFKADFNIELLCSANYMCHLYVAKKELLKEVGPLRSEYEGSQDYDLILRCVEKTDKIVHIPKVLYHWRSHMDSTAGNPASKDYAYVSGQKAIEEYYRRCGIEAEVTRLTRGFYRTKYKLSSTPLVTIIILNRDHREDLERCIRSIEEKTEYPNLEYLIVENNSEEEETFRYYKELQQSYKNIRILEWKLPFNYSAINNYAVQQARGEYFLLLNNDTEMIEKDCIEEMLSACMQDKVGIVGARLFYPDGIIQHAGVIVGLGGIAGHAFLGLSGKDIGYFARVCCQQEYSAVTAACMMVKKEVYLEAGGMDEKFEVAFNDVDFCLRVRQLGYKVVYNPFATMYHYESKTRGIDDTDEKVKRFQGEIDRFADRWKEFLEQGDPFYNPNLTLVRHDFSLKV